MEGSLRQPVPAPCDLGMVPSVEGSRRMATAQACGMQSSACATVPVQISSAPQSAAHVQFAQAQGRSLQCDSHCEVAVNPVSAPLSVEAAVVGEKRSRDVWYLGAAQQAACTTAYAECGARVHATEEAHAALEGLTGPQSQGRGEFVGVDGSRKRRRLPGTLAGTVILTTAVAGVWGP